ncbi:MAG TPA: PAS domain S-box protein [Chloroflexota bacterium]|nr:PAS domain S-box protein [Chloroflexota bacterium]
MRTSPSSVGGGAARGTEPAQGPARAAPESRDSYFRAFVDAAPDGIVAVDRAGRIVLVNSRAEQLFGYAREELLGQPVEVLVPAGLRAQHERDRERYTAAPRTRPMGAGLALTARRKDGSELPVEISLSPLGEGEDQLVMSIIRDVSERRAADAEQARLLAQAEAAEARFRAFVEAAPDGIVVVDATGKIVLVNSQAEKMFGYAREELLGQLVEILVPERFHQQHERDRRGYTAAPRTRPMGAGLALTARRKDGSELPVEISLSPLKANGELLVMSIIRDVTERKRAEDELRRTAERLAEQTAELERSNAELQQFAYVASHDLQEPLRMVASYTQLLARRYGDKLDADAQEFINYAVDGARRMQALINDLLVYSRVGTRAVEFEPVDCNAVVDQVVADLGAAIEDERAVVTRGNLPTIMADELQMSQLFQNLIGNAIKFHGERAPRVDVNAERQGSNWLFSVRDNGIGIEPQYIDRIFVIFQRLHSRAEYPGTGIGLAICKKIVERHGGRIWLESQVGEGTTFYFTLPARGGRPR